MQKFTKAEMEAQAAKFMQAHECTTFLGTADGNYFHPKDRNAAIDHDNKNVKEGVFEFGEVAEPGDQEEEISLDPQNAIKEPAAAAVANIDVDRHGEDVPKPKAKEATKPKAKAKK